MSRRRDDLRALFAGSEPAKPEPAPETKALVPRFARPEGGVPNPQPRASSGALKAMSLELDGLREAAEEGERLKSRLQAGESVVDLSPALIDQAFVRDRMAEPREADQALEASLQTHGQQVPILVRPHPASPGRYEAVYGHRRLAALARLGLPVKAIVRSLDDDALVIAQGQENNARQDLSFIERARFAAALEGRGFARATVKAALAVHSADITRYGAVVAAIPAALIEAIGPAPGIGRPRWMALAAALGGAPLSGSLRALLAEESFRALPSDRRFDAVMRQLAPRAPTADAERPLWRGAGDLAVELRRRGSGPAEFRLSGADGPAFAEFMARCMDALMQEFARAKAPAKSGGSG